MNLRKPVKYLACTVTLGNLLCGYLAVINVIEGSLTHAAWWIIIAALFDLLDGKVARLTGTASAFGIEFDSLADIISFGIAPAVLFHTYLLTDAGNMGYFLAYVYVAAGTIRLARFNTHADTREKHGFIGMPIPSAAGILSSFVLFSEHVWGGFVGFDVAVALLIGTSAAMISTFHYISMPKLGLDGPAEIAMSIWMIMVVTGCTLFPDELFFPLGIVYLLSGPIRYLSAPAVHFVFNRGDR